MLFTQLQFIALTAQVSSPVPSAYRSFATGFAWANLHAPFTDLAGVREREYGSGAVATDGALPGGLMAEVMGTDCLTYSYGRRLYDAAAADGTAEYLQVLLTSAEDLFVSNVSIVVPLLLLALLAGALFRKLYRINFPVPKYAVVLLLLLHAGLAQACLIATTTSDYCRSWRVTAIAAAVFVATIISYASALLWLGYILLGKKRKKLRFESFDSRLSAKVLRERYKDEYCIGPMLCIPCTSWTVQMAEADKPQHDLHARNVQFSGRWHVIAGSMEGARTLEGFGILFSSYREEKIALSFATLDWLEKLGSVCVVCVLPGARQTLLLAAIRLVCLLAVIVVQPHVEYSSNLIDIITRLLNLLAISSLHLTNTEDSVESAASGAFALFVVNILFLALTQTLGMLFKACRKSQEAKTGSPEVMDVNAATAALQEARRLRAQTPQGFLVAPPPAQVLPFKPGAITPVEEFPGAAQLSCYSSLKPYFPGAEPPKPDVFTFQERIAPMAGMPTRMRPPSQGGGSRPPSQGGALPGRPGQPSAAFLASLR